jgi:hypothetical protein
MTNKGGSCGRDCDARKFYELGFMVEFHREIAIWG